MAQALRDAYRDIFLIKEHPGPSDRAAIEGKFKSFHNASDNVAALMAKTFLGLLQLADVFAKKEPPARAPVEPSEQQAPKEAERNHRSEERVSPELHYNIQIHLPATKDVEVFNAIFKALKEHLL